MPGTPAYYLAFFSVNGMSFSVLWLYIAEIRRIPATMALDALDRAILALLVEDAKQSQVQMAERLPLSPTAIARRIRALEAEGVIEGYQARLSRKTLDLGAMVVVQVSLKSQNEELLAAFEKAAISAPSVISCHLMSGDDDYILVVLARDLDDFERIHKEQLSRLPGVTRLRSSFALREVVNRQLPPSCILPQSAAAPSK